MVIHNDTSFCRGVQIVRAISCNLCWRWEAWTSGISSISDGFTTFRCLVIFSWPHRPWCVAHWAGCFEDPPCAQSWRLCKGGSSSSPHWAAEIPGKTSTSPPMPPISDAEHRWISEPNRRPELVVPSPSSHPIDVEWWVKCRYWPSIFWSAHTANQAQTMNLWFYMVVYTQSVRFHSTVYWLWDQTTWFGLVHKQIGQWLRLCPSNFGPHQLLLWRWCRLVWGTGTSTPYAIRARWRFWKRTNPGGRLSFSSNHFQPSVFHWWFRMFQDVSGASTVMAAMFFPELPGVAGLLPSCRPTIANGITLKTRNDPQRKIRNIALSSTVLGYWQEIKDLCGSWFNVTRSVAAFSEKYFITSKQSLACHP